MREKLTFIVFNILLFEDRLVLSPTKQDTGSKRVKKSIGSLEINIRKTQN